MKKFFLLMMVLVGLSYAEYKKTLIYDPTTETYKWVLVWVGTREPSQIGGKVSYSDRPTWYEKNEVERKNEQIAKQKRIKYSWER